MGHEKCNDSLPDPPPGSRYRWILLTPRPALKDIQRLFSRFGIDGLIDRKHSINPTLSKMVRCVADTLEARTSTAAGLRKPQLRTPVAGVPVRNRAFGR